MQRYRESVEKFDFHFTAWHNDVWKPVITAVNGICAGGGFHWIADSDIVIAASDAQFFDPHVSIGQVVSIEAIGLMKRMPVEAVMRMAFVGRYERMSAQRAYELGMISEVVDPPERLRDAAQELAEKIAKNSPAAMAATKRALWGALEMGLTDACKAGARELVGMWGHPDQEEGPRAFAEKREPQLAAARTETGAVTDVQIGTAVIAYIEPHAGQAQAFNRWYERDHFYAAATAGPGRVLGRALGRDARVQGGATRRTRRGSAIRRAARTSATVWLLEDKQAEWDAWVAREMESLRTQARRMFAGRDHLHTAVYRFRGEHCARARRRRQRRPRSTIRSRA